MAVGPFSAGLLATIFVFCLLIEANAASGLGDFYEDEKPSRTSKDSIGKGIQAVVEDAKALATAPLRMDRQDLLMTAGALAIVGGTFALDHSLQSLAQRNRTQTGQDVAKALETTGSQLPLFAVNAALIAGGVTWQSWGGSSALKETGLISLEAQLFTGVAMLALKETVGRARPAEQHGTTSFHPFSGGASFPSSHAAGSFAIAAVLADRSDPVVGWVAYAVATAVAASRVYTNAHFSSDVVAGSLLGWGVGTFLSRQHPANSSDWTISPLAVDHGQGVMIGRRF